MVEQHPTDTTDTDTEQKFYLPAGVSPASPTGPFERIRNRLFSQRI